MESISTDAKATLLLVSQLRQKANEDTRILAPTEYDDLMTWMDSQSLSLTDLLNMEKVESGLDGLPGRDRIANLLSRRLALSVSLESWSSQSIGALCAKDSSFPVKWIEKLKRVPPIVFVAGNLDLVNKGGVAIVGSRHIEKSAEEFTQKLGKSCAALGVQVISGGAKGVDQIALTSSLENGGTAIAVLADSLSKATLSPVYREFLRNGSLLLLSPYDPEAHFMVGNAMARNRLIYSLSDIAVVVNSDAKTGGTWAGATENMKNGWAPLYVRSSENPVQGNVELIALGGTPIEEGDADNKDAIWKLIKQRETNNCVTQETESKRINDQQTLQLF